MPIHVWPTGRYAAIMPVKHLGIYRANSMDMAFVLSAPVISLAHIPIKCDRVAIYIVMGLEWLRLPRLD